MNQVAGVKCQKLTEIAGCDTYVGDYEGLAGLFVNDSGELELLVDLDVARWLVPWRFNPKHVHKQAEALRVFTLEVARRYYWGTDNGAGWENIHQRSSAIFTTTARTLGATKEQATQLWFDEDKLGRMVA